MHRDLEWPLLDANFAHQRYSVPHLDSSQLRWTRVQEEEARQAGAAKPLVLTDVYLGRAAPVTVDAARPLIAWLLEPPCIAGQQLYDWIKRPENAARFAQVWTFSADVLRALGPRKAVYVAGGTWLRPEDIRLWPKEWSAPVSFIASDKRATEGHRLRHSIQAVLPTDGTNGAGGTGRTGTNGAGGAVDTYGKIAGSKFGHVPFKADALRRYPYSIAVENMRYAGYFTEKLLDCFLTGTVPIYWGDRSAPDRLFDSRGILHFTTLGELLDILTRVVSQADWEGREAARRYNYMQAHRFLIPEETGARAAAAARDTVA